MKCLSKISILSLIIAMSVNLSATAQRDRADRKNVRVEVDVNDNRRDFRDARKDRRERIRKQERRRIRRNVARTNHRRNTAFVRHHAPRRAPVVHAGFGGYYGPTFGVTYNTRPFAGRYVRPVVRRSIYRNHRRPCNTRFNRTACRVGFPRTCS